METPQTPSAPPLSSRGPKAGARQTVRQPIPEALADVALIDGPTCAAAGCMALSRWHDLVREGKAPQPVIRANRCTRWRLADVRRWLVERAEAGQIDDSTSARPTVESARAASAAARAKRQQAATA